MTNTQTQEVITNALTQWGSSVLAILGVVIGIGLAYLIFRFGWRAVQNSVGGYGHGEKDGTYTYKVGNGIDSHRDTFNDPNFKY